VVIVDLAGLPGHAVSHVGSQGFTVAPVGRVTDGHVTCLHLAAGGRIGRHAAVGNQLLVLLSGDATVSGDDGAPVPLRPGQAASWVDGELHETVSVGGMTAVVVEGDGQFTADTSGPRA
jgi:hypothetical protein